MNLPFDKILLLINKMEFLKNSVSVLDYSVAKKQLNSNSNEKN